MHTPESVFAEVAYRRERAQHSWPGPRGSARRRQPARYAGAQDPAPGTTLRDAFTDLLRLVRYRLGRWGRTHPRTTPRAAAITLRLTPTEEGALAGLARTEGISRHEATVQAIRLAASRTRR